jgi:hypothetical protein
MHGKGVERALLAPIALRRPERKFGVLGEVSGNRITHCVLYNVRTWIDKESTKVQSGFQAESPSQEGCRSRFYSSSPTKNRSIYTRGSCDCAAGKIDQNPKWEYVFSASLSLCSDASVFMMRQRNSKFSGVRDCVPQHHRLKVDATCILVLLAWKELQMNCAEIAQALLTIRKRLTL